MTRRRAGSLSIHVERLVIDGALFEATQRDELGASFQRELSDLLASGGLDVGRPGRRSVPLVAAAGPAGIASRDPVDFGRQVAASVFREIGGELPSGPAGTRS